MDSGGPLLATHFLLEKQVEARAYDGFRIIARKDGDRVRLYSRPGNDFTRRFKREAEEDWGQSYVAR